MLVYSMERYVPLGWGYGCCSILARLFVTCWPFMPLGGVPGRGIELRDYSVTQRSQPSGYSLMLVESRIDIDKRPTPRRYKRPVFSFEKY